MGARVGRVDGDRLLEIFQRPSLMFGGALAVVLPAAQEQIVSFRDFGLSAPQSGGFVRQVQRKSIADALRDLSL